MTEKKAKRAEHGEGTVERNLFAANFRRARTAAGLSQRDVHTKTGLAQSYISGVERAILNISVDNMARLAEVVGKPLHELLRPIRAEDSAD